MAAVRRAGRRDVQRLAPPANHIQTATPLPKQDDVSTATFISAVSERPAPHGLSVACTSKQLVRLFFLRVGSVEYDNEVQAQQLETAYAELKAYSDGTRADLRRASQIQQNPLAPLRGRDRGAKADVMRRTSRCGIVRGKMRYVTPYPIGCSTVLRGAVVAAAMLIAGCAVPQGRGKGKEMNLVESASGRHYWLYLPERYPVEATPGKSGTRWPLVVTLHGMKPFDSYTAQIREWQQQADAYGLIVCAPDLHTSDLFMELPLKRVHSYVERDERNILNMMDQVLRRTDADPSRVLITSWSSGGYLAHYLLNQHPERFTCLAVRQSNFSSYILEPRQIPKYPRYPRTPIAIFFGQNDFAICRRESREAIVWYRERGFEQVEAFSVEGLGHERTPETAANFFARVCQLQPLDKALAQRTLARVRTQPVVLASAEPMPNSTPATRLPARPRSDQPTARTQTNAPTSVLPDARRTAQPVVKAQDVPGKARPQAPAIPPPPSRPPGNQPKAPPPPTKNQSEISIVLSSPGGVAPFYLHFSVQIPQRLREGADCLWLHNGEPVCTGTEGRKILRTPGQHRIEVLVTTADRREFRARQTVIVQPKTPPAQR